MLEVAAFVGVRHIYIKGDFADFYNLHQHGPKDPRVVHSLTSEIEAVRFALDELDALFPDARKHFIQGNHEWRLERYIQNKCPELFGFVTCQQLLQIEGRPNWVWHRYWPDQKCQVLNAQLWLRHEPLASSAAASLRKAMCSHSWGHTHRIDEAKIKGLNHEIVAWSDGWLGDDRKDEVFGYVKGHFAWQKGFSIVMVDPADGSFQYEVCRITDEFKTFFRGKRFKS